MKTRHQLIQGDARDLDSLPDESIHLVVTSPPYPMIEMWDPAFRAMSPAAGAALDQEEALTAFEAMHQELDRVWEQCFRVLIPGGFACINIGDATRSLAGTFRLFHNHARVITSLSKTGFTVLPDILWRKPTNAPNKFMGSGMLPAGAYATYEHEYILILRKGNKRIFSTAEDKANRARSAYFWEERNSWFSDVWEGVGSARQTLEKPAKRERSGAFPLALPHRLILMFSVYGDTVLDPFAGTGTTLAAALIAGRSSLGVECDKSLLEGIPERLSLAAIHGSRVTLERLDKHRAFVQERIAKGGAFKHHNVPHDVPVITGQERTMELRVPNCLDTLGPGEFEATHASLSDSLSSEPAAASVPPDDARSR